MHTDRRARARPRRAEVNIYCTLTPAYGRDYTARKAIVADLNAGKDFIFSKWGHADDGRLANLESLNDALGRGSEMKVNVRYKRLAAITVVTITRDVVLDEATGATVTEAVAS